MVMFPREEARGPDSISRSLDRARKSVHLHLMIFFPLMAMAGCVRRDRISAMKYEKNRLFSQW